MVHTLCLLPAGVCCCCCVLFPYFIATTSIFDENSYYYFHSPSHFLLPSVSVPPSFAHLHPLCCFSSNSTIHRSLPTATTLPHTNLLQHTVIRIRRGHVTVNTKNTVTVDRICCAFFFGTTKKKTAFESHLWFQLVILRLLCAYEFCRGTI